MIQKKSLLVLVAAGLLSGCGYDDGKAAKMPDLHAMPETCVTTYDCMADDGEFYGICQGGKCVRTCEETIDCEAGAVCESKVCRKVEPCPHTSNYSSLDTNAAEKITKINNSKCIKVFSHTMNTNWSGIMSDDMRFDRKLVEAIGASNDYTSDDYNLTLLKQYTTGRRMNFAFLMYMGDLYFNIIRDLSNNLAACYKPQIYHEGKYIDIPNHTYNATYVYDYNHDFINDPSEVDAVCNSPFNGADEDMKEYLKYMEDILENSDNSVVKDYAFEAYMQMTISKPECAKLAVLIQRMGTMGKLVTGLVGADSKLTSVVLKMTDYVSRYNPFDLKKETYVKTIPQIAAQKELCKSTMAAINENSGMMRKVFLNDDMKLHQCLSADAENVFVARDDLKEEEIREAVYSGNQIALMAVANPNMIMFDSRRFMGLSVTVNKDVYNGPLKPKAFLLETLYSASKASFDNNLVSDSVILQYPDYALKENYSELKENISGIAYTFLPYSSMNAGQAVLGHALYDFGCSNPAECQKDLITIFYKVHQKNLIDNSLMQDGEDGTKFICGGLITKNETVAGYVVLDDNVEVSSRAVSAEQKN